MQQTIGILTFKCKYTDCARYSDFIQGVFVFRLVITISVPKSWSFLGIQLIIETLRLHVHFFLLSKIALTINLLLGHGFCLGAEKRGKCEINGHEFWDKQ